MAEVNVMQALLNCGLNGFAAQLLAESLLRHPGPMPAEFVLPIRSVPGWAGVRFKLEPIPDEGHETPTG